MSSDRPFKTFKHLHHIYSIIFPKHGMSQGNHSAVSKARPLRKYLNPTCSQSTMVSTVGSCMRRKRRNISATACRSPTPPISAAEWKSEIFATFALDQMSELNDRPITGKSAKFLRLQFQGQNQRYLSSRRFVPLISGPGLLCVGVFLVDATGVCRCPVREGAFAHQVLFRLVD